MTNEDLDKIKTEKDKTIHILHFVDVKEIEPMYFNKTYNVIPEAGGEKAFELFRNAMQQEGKVALAKTVMGIKETLLAVIPSENGILMETLFYEDEIKDMPKSISKPEINQEELNMAKTLINSMIKPFEPELYKDEYQERLKEVLEQKIAGKEIVTPKPEEDRTNVIDLMDALKASVEQAKKDKGA